MASDPVELEVSGRTVTITSPDKVFFGERGDTKLDVKVTVGQRPPSRPVQPER